MQSAGKGGSDQHSEKLSRSNHIRDMVALFGATSRFREPYCIRRRSEDVQLAHSGGRGDWWICK